MMKIAVNAYPLVSPLSGVGQYVLQLYRAMDGLGQDIDYFNGYHWMGRLTTGAGRWVTAVHGLTQSSGFVRRLMGLERNLAFAAGAAWRGIDLYHEPNFIPLRTLAPCVITIHDLSPIECPDTHGADWARVFKQRLPAAVRRARAILTISDYTRGRVIEHFPEAADKVHTTLLAAREGMAPLDARGAAGVMDHYGLAHGRYVLSVGTLEPRKNLVSVLRAYASLDERLRSRFPLVIAGMQGWLTGEFDAEVEPLRRSGQVRLLGFVPDAWLPALYSGARLLVYPSLYEGFGLPPLEAMACGTPVITSNRTSLPEVVGDAGLQREPLDIDGLGRSMRQLMEDDTLHADLRQRGLARAALFTWRDTALKTLDVFRGALP